MDANNIGQLGKFSLESALTNKARELGGRVASADPAQRQKVAQEFAALLYSEVLKAMRATMAQNGFDDKESMSRDFYTAMMDNEIARAVAKRDSDGLVKSVVRALEKAAPTVRATSQPMASAGGIVSSGFGLRKDPLDGVSKFHQGVDVVAAPGTAVRSAAPGKVVFSGWSKGFGNLVEVDHGNGLTTRYGHNVKNLVNAGAQVDAGEPIALVGSSGRSSGAHLHFEVRRLGKAINPEALIGRLSKGTKISSLV